MLQHDTPVLTISVAIVHGMVCLSFSLYSSNVCVRGAHSCSGRAASWPPVAIDITSTKSI